MAEEISLPPKRHAERLTEQRNPRSKHIDLKVHHVRNLIRKGVLKLVKVGSSENPADLLTKNLPRPAFNKYRDLLVMAPPNSKTY